MKNILYILMGVLILSGCTKKFDELNVDPKNPTVVPSESLFTSAQKELGDQVGSTNVNTNNFRLWSQYWQETTYLDESQYDVKTRAVPDNAWETWYRDVLMDFNDAKRVLASEPVFPPGVESETELINKQAIIELNMVFAYHRLVDMYGDVPYSESLDVDGNILPAYDDAWTIYQDLVDRIDAAYATMDDSYGSFGSSDLVYGGDVASWMRFAQSMKLKIGIMVADAHPSESVQWVNDAVAAGVISNNAENAELEYLGSTPNTSTLYVDLVLSGRKDFVAGKTIVDTMNYYNDPRLSEYFQIVCLTDVNGDDSCVYRGGVIGASSSWSDHSKPGTILYEPMTPVVLMAYDEVQFYLAEAAERGGYSTPGSAQTHYENAITASFDYWGAMDVATYLATDNVAWGTGIASNMEKIVRESWLGFYNRGFEGYTQIRRHRYHELMPLAEDAVDGHYPVRYTYPIVEQTLNGSNWSAAASNIGGDLSDTRLFWDVN